MNINLNRFRNILIKNGKPVSANVYSDLVDIFNKSKVVVIDQIKVDLAKE